MQKQENRQRLLCLAMVLKEAMAENTDALIAASDVAEENVADLIKFFGEDTQ